MGEDVSVQGAAGQKNSAFNMELRALFPFIWAYLRGKTSRTASQARTSSGA